MTVKEQAIQWIQSLPDDCTLEDIRYHLYLREKVQEGMSAFEQGQVCSHDEVKRRMAEWLKSYGQPQP